MVLECHMLRLNACKDSCEAWAFLDVGQLPEGGFHCLEKMSSKSRKNPLFMEQLPDAGRRMRSVHLAVLFHAWTVTVPSWNKPPKAFDQSKVSKSWLIRIDFQLPVLNFFETLFLLYFKSKIVHFYFTRGRKTLKFSFCHNTGERQMCSYSVSEFDFNILLHRKCQSNPAASQTSPRVVHCSTSLTMLHCSLHITYLRQWGRGFNKETIR